MALSDNACDSLPSSVHEEEELDLPIGYRFCPEDDELLTHYLANKLLGRQLSANIIRDIDLYEYDPDQLPIGEFFVLAYDRILILIFFFFEFLLF